MKELYVEYKALDDSLMDGRDEQAELLALVSQLFANIDEITAERIQARIDREGADGYAKALEASAMEADAAEVGTWLGSYLQTPLEAYRERILTTPAISRGTWLGSRPCA